MHISPTSLEGQTLLECVCAPTRREPKGLLMLQSLGSMYSCSGCALHKGTTYTWILFPLQISSLFCKIFKFLLLLYWLQWWDIYTQCPSNNNKIFWVFFYKISVHKYTKRWKKSYSSRIDIDHSTWNYKEGKSTSKQELFFCPDWWLFSN